MVENLTALPIRRHKTSQSVPVRRSFCGSASLCMGAQRSRVLCPHPQADLFLCQQTSLPPPPSRTTIPPCVPLWATNGHSRHRAATPGQSHNNKAKKMQTWRPAKQESESIGKKKEEAALALPLPLPPQGACRIPFVYTLMILACACRANRGAHTPHPQSFLLDQGSAEGSNGGAACQNGCDPARSSHPTGVARHSGAGSGSGRIRGRPFGPHGLGTRVCLRHKNRPCNNRKIRILITKPVSLARSLSPSPSNNAVTPEAPPAVRHYTHGVITHRGRGGRPGSG